MHVKPLDKPAGTPCSHQSESGCGIYHERPSVCRSWFCLWVRDGRGLFDEQHRPDRLGVFFTASEPDPETGEQTIYAHEVHDGAAADPEVRTVIRHLNRAAPVRVLPHRSAGSPLTPLTFGRTGNAANDADADAA
jgi:Fe-S-cluster containining protein